MLADVGVPERREVEVGALGRLEDDGAAVGGVGEDVEGLVVPEDGPVQVVGVALGVLGEDEGEVEDAPAHRQHRRVALAHARPRDVRVLR